MHQDQLSQFDKWQKSFINEKKVLNMSKSTILNYTGILDRLYDYYSLYELKIAFYDIDRDFIITFLQSRGDLATNTKNLHITVIKNFFTFVSTHNKDGIDFRSRFLDLKAKAKKSEPEYLNNDEYEILLKHLHSKVQPKSFIQYRNRLTLKLLLFTGLRASEVLSIKLQDFLLLKEEGVFKIKILGKGNKERFVYIQTSTIEYELQWITHYYEENPHEEKKCNENFINLTTKGRVMLRGELYSLIENLFKKLGIEKRGVHLLRHTFGKKMVQKNINLSTIKELMGHENIQTTMIYARSDEGNMIAAVLL